MTQVVKDLAAVMLSSRAGPTDSEPIASVELRKQVTTAWQLRQRAAYQALGQMLPTLISQGLTSVAMLHGADQYQAGRAVVHTYNAASSLLKRLGDRPLALVAADRAVFAAREVGDPVLTAAAMYRLANVLLTARRLNETAAVALQAADLVEPAKEQTPRSLAMWGALLLTAAVAAAGQGDESLAWELLGEARAASRWLGTDHADIYAIFGPTNVAMHGVQVAVEMHNGAEAIRRSLSVIPDRLPTHLVERRGQFLIDVARGHALQGDDPLAVVTLLRAEHVAPQEVLLSPDVHDLIRTLLSRERAGATPGLCALTVRLGLAG